MMKHCHVACAAAILTSTLLYTPFAPCCGDHGHQGSCEHASSHHGHTPGASSPLKIWEFPWRDQLKYNAYIALTSVGVRILENVLSKQLPYLATKTYHWANGTKPPKHNRQNINQQMQTLKNKALLLKTTKFLFSDEKYKEHCDSLRKQVCACVENNNQPQLTSHAHQHGHCSHKHRHKH